MHACTPREVSTACCHATLQVEQDDTDACLSHGAVSGETVRARADQHVAAQHAAAATVHPDAVAQLATPDEAALLDPDATSK